MSLVSWKKGKKEVGKKHPDESKVVDTENLDKYLIAVNSAWKDDYGKK